MKTLLKFFTVTFLVMLAFTVSAQEDRNPKPPKTPEELAQTEVDRMKKAIPLTDEQAKLIFEYYATYQREKAALPADASNEEKTLVLRKYNTALKELIGAEAMADWRDYQAIEKAERDAQKAKSATGTAQPAPAEPEKKVEKSKTIEELAQENVEKLKAGIPDLTEEQIDLLYQLNFEMERESAWLIANDTSAEAKTALNRKYDIILKSIISHKQLVAWRDYAAITQAAARKR